MIQHIKFLLEYKGEDKFTMPVYKLSYQLYGHICHALDDFTVEEFHKSQVALLSQYFIKGENQNCFEWNVFIFGDNLNEIDDMSI